MASAPSTRSPPAAPDPPGYGAAIQEMGTVAAPLLGGFGFTLVVYALTSTTAFRWPNAVLALILAAALSLIASVQCTTVARLFAGPAGADPAVNDAAAHRLWARRAERTYNVGVLLLLCGITVALVPPGPAAELGGRVIAIAVGLLGLAVVALWMTAAYPPARWIAGRFLEEPRLEAPMRESTKEAP